MFYFYFLITIIAVYMFYDLNYIIRTIFTVWSGRIFEDYYCLNEVTTIYGLCTFQDCDIWFRSIRLARVLRELDFARFHFYDRTGIYCRSQEYGIKSLQGSTLTVALEPIPLFTFYKITTKLVYWDTRSLFLEHEVITLHDNRLRCTLVSRQFALGRNKDLTTALLLEGLSGFKTKPNCPQYISSWLESMKLSSENLKNSQFNTYFGVN